MWKAPDVFTVCVHITKMLQLDEKSNHESLTLLFFIGLSPFLHTEIEINAWKRTEYNF